MPFLTLLLDFVFIYFAFHFVLVIFSLMFASGFVIFMMALLERVVFCLLILFSVVISVVVWTWYVKGKKRKNCKWWYVFDSGWLPGKLQFTYLLNSFTSLCFVSQRWTCSLIVNSLCLTVKLDSFWFLLLLPCNLHSDTVLDYFCHLKYMKMCINIYIYIFVIFQLFQQSFFLTHSWIQAYQTNT